MNNDQETFSNNHSNDQSFSNGQQQVEMHDPRLMKPMMRTFGDYLIEELYRNNLVLNPYYVELIKLKLNEYDQFNLRRFEEKDQFINQLKQNLVELTEKRFRQLNDSNGGSVDPNSLNTNMKFVLNEKDNQITDLLKQLNDYEKEIERLKQTIKEQDTVILSHNNNIYELKNNHETVLKAKQESFRMMNDDLSRKQKLIDDLNSTNKNLKEKIESLEEQHSKSRQDLEKRLSDKEIDLQTKIATFEANLREGRHYFEDILVEKEKIINEKTLEVNHLKQKLNITIDDFKVDAGEIKTTNTDLKKFDSENLKNIKSLYEHQIELLKVKIEMLEKTCQNYQKGIKEMNKSYGHQQQADEITSIQSFKDLMQEMHKTNAQLETERIDLQVKVAKLKEDLDQVRLEKENLNRKFLNADQLSQKLQSERNDVELNFKRQLDLKLNEINHLSNELATQRTDNERLRAENDMLIQNVSEYEQLKLTHSQLTQHYEQLYNQASEIVTGNQLLNEQAQQNALQIQELNQMIEDYQLKIDHLEHCNSELNTQKINLDMKLVAAENKFTACENDLKELSMLRNSKLNVEKLTQVNKDLELELLEKNELIEQLNQAKEFLSENNSKLLTNNIRIQLFIESMGLDLSALESNSTVSEYDSLRNEFKEAQFQLNEIKILNQQLEINQQNFKDLISSKESEIKNLLDQLNEMKLEMENASNSVNRMDACAQVDLISDELVDLRQQHKLEINSLNKQYSEQISQYETNFSLIQTENESLNSQLDETKQHLKDLQLKYQESLSEKSNANNDALLNELNSVKARYEETLKKQSDLEQLNLKLKAKLKQFVKEKQQAISEQKQTALPQVITESTSTQTDTIEEENSDQEITAENLILFGSKIATSDLHEHFSFKIDEIQNRMNLLLLNNEYKLQASNREVKQLKEKLKQHETHQPVVNKQHSISSHEQSTQTEPAFGETNLEDKLNLMSSALSTTQQMLNEKIADLEKELVKSNELRSANEHLASEHESLKTKYDSLRVKTAALKEKLKKVDETLPLIEELKVKHKDELDQLHKMYTAQLSQFEVNFTSIQNENELLSAQLEEAQKQVDKQLNIAKSDASTETVTDPLLVEYELSLRNYQLEIEALNKQLDELKQNSNELHALRTKHEDLIQKQTNLEQMNLKLKAKLKQTLTQQKQQQQQQALLSVIEDRSSCSTPTLSPNNTFDSHTEAKSTQTDLVDIDELESLVASYKSELEILNSQLENSHADRMHLNDQLKESETSSKELIASLEARIKQLEQQDLHQVKLDTASPVKSSDAGADDLAAKYEQLKQQNLKLKAKVKQLLKADESSKQLADADKQHAKESDSGHSTLKAKINELELENQGLKSQLSSMREQLETEIISKNSDINKLNEDLAQLKEKDQSFKVNELNHVIKDYEFKLDELNSSLANLTEANEKLNFENSNLVKSLSESTESHSIKISEHEQLVQTYQMQISELNQKVESLLSSNQMLNDKASRVESLEKLVKDYEFKIEQLNAEIAELEKENEELANRSQTNSASLLQIDQFNSEISQLKQQNDELLSRTELFSAQVIEKQNLIQTQENRIEQLNAEISILEIENKELVLKSQSNESTQVEQLSCEINTLKEQNENLTSGNRLLSDQLAQKEHLEKSLKDSEYKIEQLSAEIAELEKENEELASRVQTSASSYVQIDQLNAEINTLKTQNQDLVINSQNLNDQLAQKESLIRTCEEKIEQLNTEIGLLEKEHEEISSKSQSYSNQIEQVNSELNKLKTQNEELLNGNQSLSEKLNQIQQLELQATEYQAKIDQLNSEVNELKRANEELSHGNQMLNSYYHANMQQIQQLDKQVKEYEFKLEQLNLNLDETKKANESELKEKDSKINDLNTELTNIKSRINDELSNQLCNGNSLNFSSTTSINSTVSTRSGLHLESQLKTCHKKCEAVVEKLNLLKKHNETLSTKLKSIKSMI